MNAQVTQIADAILYEGYLLYPYRASAVKNNQRWNFGVLYPPDYAAKQQGVDVSEFQCECLVRGAVVSVTVRFLHLLARDRYDAGGRLIHTWQEAVAREVEIASEGEHHIRFDAGEEREQLEEGEILRRREPVEAMVDFRLQPAGVEDWQRASIRIANVAHAFGVPRRHSGDASTETGNRDWIIREAALRRSLVSTHAILRVTGGQFASQIDPPEGLQHAAAQCVSRGLFPVLAGDDAMLASPIILYDHPQIAPESAGALFDGTEIDEILSLRVLTLTDDEKREMRETDPQGRRILERTESLSPEQWLQLHGVLRAVRGREDV